MSTYGRNFEFRVPPVHGQRRGRFYTDAAVMIGAAIESGTDDDGSGRHEVTQVTTATTPVSGKHGLCVYEFGPAAYAGDDAQLTTYSDKDTAPAGASVQMVSGRGIKVVLRNTEDRTFLNVRDYAGKKVVAGLGATPTLTEGDYLTPADGTTDPDTGNGLWAEGNATNGWLIITHVDNDRGEVEAEMTF